MTRDEHLTWCKRRALEYVNHHKMNEALASMGSDLNKHPETANHPGMLIGLQMQMNGMLSDQDDMRRFIEGFN